VKSSTNSKTVTLSIDGTQYEVEKGLTILKAAQLNNIYIPTLCDHEELSPHGGCRLCIVEVKGMRVYPAACTTPVEEGQEVRTDTPELESIRKQLLKLILGEHPSSCLICEERADCKSLMGRTKKAAVTTGCRYCPADGQCELQELAERMNITELDFPIDYRGLAVSADDPFIESNLNLCVLCGRCVRVCREVNGADILAVQHRGPTTIVGPAFGRTRMDAGCEFCGECVSVCPTGALFEKVRKWDGVPERETVTTCALCGVGCQLRLSIRGDKVIGTLPAEDPVVNQGRLCVKGRFCVTELLNHHKRLKKPYRIDNGGEVEIQWEQALDLAAERISACDPSRFGMVVSSNCANEDLYIAQKFTRAAVGSNNIDTDARRYYGTAFRAYLDLMSMSVPLSDLDRASAILCIGLDARFERSIVGSQIRKAVERGAKLVTVSSREHSLSAFADRWLRPPAGAELRYLDAMCDAMRPAGTARVRLQAEYRDITFELPAAAGLLMDASDVVIVIGSAAFSGDDGARVLERAAAIAQNLCAGVIPLPAQGNLYGSLMMGAYPELLPGGFSSANQEKRNELFRFWRAGLPEAPGTWSSEPFLSKPDLSVLYLVGDVPAKGAPSGSFTIVQNIYPPDSMAEASLVLPSVAFTEMDGTLFNSEGRIQRSKKAVPPPGEALPDWEILCRIARKMGKKGFEFRRAREVHEEIACLTDAMGDFERPARRPAALGIDRELFLRPDQAERSRTFGAPAGPDETYPYLLTVSIEEHTYKGFALRHRVGGARAVFPHGVVKLSPKDAADTNVSDGDEIVVMASDFERVWPVRVADEQTDGVLHVVLSREEVPGANPAPAKMSKKNV
jgi:formate dehydrogenase (NADP+) alpha subunit